MKEIKYCIPKAVKQFNLMPKKSLGQNFIYNKTLCDKIVDHSKIPSQDYIIEIGPGPGGLTSSIINKLCPKKTILVEIDKKAILLLKNIYKNYTNISIINQDILKTELIKFDIPKPLHIISNIPYNITSRLLLYISKNNKLIKSATIMLQTEVAEKISAKVGSKNYGALSVIIQSLFNCDLLFNISKKEFFPEPNISSTLIKLTPKKINLTDKDVISFFKLIKEVFNMRRKKIIHVLKKFCIDKDDILKKLNISSDLRPQNLSPDIMLSLYKYIKTMKSI